MTMLRTPLRFCHFLLLSGSALLGMGTAVLGHSPVELEIERVSHRLAAQPEDIELLITRGELHRTAQNFAAAQQDFLTARRLVPNRPNIDLYVGILTFEWGRPSEAIVHLSCYLDPPRRNDAPSQALSLAHESRAKAFLALGRHDQAVEDFSRAIALSSDTAPEIFLARAQAIRDAAGIGRENEDAIPKSAAILRALAGLDEGITRLGSVISLENAAIELELLLGRHERALARLDRAFAKVNRKDLWLDRRGELLHAAGRVDEAKAAWRSALAAIRALPAARRTAPATAERRAAIDRQLALLGERTP